MPGLCHLHGSCTLHSISLNASLLPALPLTDLAGRSPAWLPTEHAHTLSRSSACPPSALQVNGLDKGTPDEWVRRHPDMIRLTSK